MASSNSGTNCPGRDQPRSPPCLALPSCELSRASPAKSAVPAWMRRASSAEGISVCPETAVCFDVLERLVAAGEVRPGETVVVFNTGAAPKYLEALPAELPRIDKDRVDWDAIAS